jgi:hypothetical protein
VAPRTSSPDQNAEYLLDKFKTTFGGIDRKIIMEKDVGEIKTIITKNIKNNTTNAF